MAKQTFYFPHDGNARNDDRIIAVRMRHKMEGYGVYFAILERMLESSNYMCVKDYNLIAFDLHVSAELVKSIVENFGLFKFTDDGNSFFSESFNNRMKPLENIREQRSLAGKRSAEKRAKKNECSTSVQRPLNKNSTEESKVKKIINKESTNVDKKKENISVEFLFEKVWELYERKGNKKTSEKKFEKLPEAIKQKIFLHIPQYVQSTPDKQYRKNFETYLNQEAWNDEIVKRSDPKPKQIGLVYQQEDFDLSRLK